MKSLQKHFSVGNKHESNMPTVDELRTWLSIKDERKILKYKGEVDDDTLLFHIVHRCSEAHANEDGEPDCQHEQGSQSLARAWPEPSHILARA